MLPIAILAGGLATRLRPVTETIPKALIEVAGEPFLAHQLRLLRRHGFERVVLWWATWANRSRRSRATGGPSGCTWSIRSTGRNCWARRARFAARCRCWATRSP